MAQAVAQSIDARSALVVEAGTGIGKTWAYLVPILLSGQRAIVSTATKGLQDQLFLRDLPRLRDHLGVSTMAAVLKGRSSYLCIQRLDQTRQSTAMMSPSLSRLLTRVEGWAQATRSGDLAEVEGLDDRSPLMPLITSTRDNCLGSECPKWSDCHLNRARREAMAADLVVINHHLFFADLLLRDSGVAELLPSVDVAVFDEAHQLVEAGLAFLGQSLSSGQVGDLAGDVVSAGLEQARGLAPWPELSADLELSAKRLTLALSPWSRGAGAAAIRLPWQAVAPSETLQDALRQLEASAERLQQALEPVAAASQELDRLLERCGQLRTRARVFLDAPPLDQVRWIDGTAATVRLMQSPLDIREAMTHQRSLSSKAWIFTSATLGDDARLSWFTAAAGLEDAQVVQLDSPFDFRTNARLWTSPAFPLPQDARHPGFVGRLAARCARELGGHTFVLTTTLRVLPLIATALRQALASTPPVGGEAADPLDWGWEVLMQGEGPRRSLLDRFGDGKRRVLVASQSFWEGIDVPGPALQCVVIDKLPFPPPHDPVVSAREKRVRSDGGRAFDQVFVAEAAVSLKQGAGRLIRSEADRGLLVICDPRMATMGYGQRLRAALPPFSGLQTEAEALDFLRSLQG